LASLNDYWSGYLGGRKGLITYTKVITIGKLPIIEIYSPDQHNQAITVSSASLKGRQLKVLSEQIKSKFSGKLAKDQKSIKRLWKQRLLPLPLTLHFSDEKPAGE